MYIHTVQLSYSCLNLKGGKAPDIEGLTAEHLLLSYRIVSALWAQARVASMPTSIYAIE